MSFQIPDNAIQYAKVFKINGKSPLVGKHQENGLFYVYAYATQDDLEYAREKRSELRATKEFYDAWIKYVGINLEDFEKEETRLPLYTEPGECVGSEQDDHRDQGIRQVPSANPDFGIR